MKNLAVALSLVAGACAGSDVPTTEAAAPNNVVSTSTAGTVGTTTSIATTTTSVDGTTTTTSPRMPSTDAWDVWTLILASLETEEPGTWDQAEEIAAAIDGAAVLWSDDYPSLNPGYWVVYWGEFSSGSEASNWCSGLPTELTCYPRYLGEAVSPLAADGHAMLIDGQALVIVDVATGARLKVFNPYFDGDGKFVGRMSLTPDGSALYFGLGGEDSWYSCESSQGLVGMLDLAFGTETRVAAGFGPAVSPDGRWLATLVAEQCLPDPEQPDSWVITPTDTVVLYDLTSGRAVETNRWSVTTPPTSYADPQMLVWVDWRADSDTLVVINNAGSVFEISPDHRGSIDTGTPLAEGIYGYPQTLIGDTLYVIVDETPEAVGTFDLTSFDLSSGELDEVIIKSVEWVLAASDTTRTRLIWGAGTRVVTAETTFEVEEYVSALGW